MYKKCCNEYNNDYINKMYGNETRVHNENVGLKFDLEREKRKSNSNLNYNENNIELVYEKTRMSIDDFTTKTRIDSQIKYLRLQNEYDRNKKCKCP